MAKISLGICLMLVVASSVIYEAQGTFLLKKYLRSKFPRKCDEFTPYANKGMIMFVTNLEGGCPATAEFKNFFTQFKSYMNFIETASASSKNIDVEMTTKCDGLFKAMSALNGGAVGKSADAGNFKATMISMGKTLVEQKKNAAMMTLAQKKSLVIAMVKWTRMIATFVKTASEKKGKTIDITSYGLDVDVNDKSIISVSGSTESGSSSTKTETKSGTVAGSGNGSTKTKETSGGSTEKGSSSTKTEDASSTKAGGSASTSTKSGSGTTFKDTTGGYVGSPSASPTSSPSATGKTSVKGNAGASGSATYMQKQSSTGSTSTSSRSSSTSVKQVESETSKEVTSFIMDLEKKYSGKADLKPFFDKLKASMTASAMISSKTGQDYATMTRSATGKLSEAMAFVGSRFSKSAKMKSNMETCQDRLMKTLKELQDINSKIVNSKTVTSTQQTELKQTITQWEQLTTQFVETAASSTSSQQQSSTSSQKQSSASSHQQSSSGMIKIN